jgi:CubicO group peptidase (beta-lactamase class C family)
MEAGGRKSLVVAACVVAVAVAVVAGCSRTPPDVSTVTSEYEAAVAETPSLTEFRASGLSRADVEGLDALGSSLEMLRGNLHIAGMSAAVVRDQELVWAKGFGLADIEQGIPAAPNTPYCLASLTKPFASTLLLELVESGQLDLDEPVADHGIEYASPGTIRVKHLFSHTSAYWPGTRYHYSGDRYSELDHVLESVAGASFRALATERILDPLGLTDTTFGPLERAMVDGFLNFRESRVEPRAVLAPDGTEYEFGDIREDDPHIMTTIGVFETLVGSVVDTSLYDFRRVPPLPVDDASLESFAAFWASQERYEDAQSRIARPYSLNADLEPVPGRYSPNNSAAAGILSSVVDLARYDAALDWNLLVGRDTQDLAFEPTVSADGDTLPYGFGWFVQRFGGKKLLWHYGYWDCASTLIVKVPEEEITFVLLANTDALSRTTAGIGMRGDVLVSPAASLFLRHLVFAPDGDPVHLDWNAPLGSLSETLASSTDPLERELLERELGAAAYVAAIGELGVRTPEELCGAADDAWSEPFVPTVDLPVVALVENVGNDDLKSEAFTLDAPRRLRVYAVGEGGRGGMYDFAWIEDTDTGGRVWFMNWPETEDAGGSGKNRKIDESFVLPAGRYALRFRADDSHAYKSWNAVPPSDGFWGAIVWDDGPAEYIDATTWEHAADPEALGWSAAGLDTVAAMLRRAGSAAFLVATDGKLVYEYGTTSYPFMLHSARKSLMSGLYGPYIHEGVMSREATLGELGIVDSPPLTETEESAQLVHLLQARSGVYIPALGETPEMAERRPERGSHDPGTFWYYNNWDFNVLGTIFIRETGEAIGEAFDRRIGRPIGMEHFEPDHVTFTYGRGSTVHPRYAFRMSARDLGRYGQLFLQEGEWEGREVIPAEWVRESTRKYSDWEDYPGIGYGYMWWTLAEDAVGMEWPAGMYHAAGYGSQYLHVIPEISTVVVHFSNTYAGGAELVDDLVAFGIVHRLTEARLE